MAEPPALAEFGLARAELPADRQPALIYLARLAPGSRRTMRTALEAIARLATGGALDADELPWWELRYQHAAAIRAELAARYAPATANRMLAALRGVLRECWRLGLLEADAYHRAADLEVVRGERLPSGRALGAGELRTLFDSCAVDEITHRGARDAALVATLYGLGLRRAEVVALALEDYDVDAATLRVIGKGNKERVGYAGAGTRDALGAWVALRSSAPGPLFCRVNRGGRIELSSLTEQAVYGILQRLSRDAGVAAFSPHDLRRTFVSDLLDAGADISAVQRLAGHASVQTTVRYDRRGEHAKRKAAELLHVPYQRRGG